MAIGVLSWVSETNLTPYPLSKSFGYDELFTDANFLQFDGFVPVLKSIKASEETLVIEIEIDTGLLSVEVQKYLLVDPRFFVTLTDQDRKIGKLVFGRRAHQVATELLSDKHIKNINIPFLSHLVKSIPSNAGVYSLNSIYDAVTFTNDGIIWETQDGQETTFNAVYVPPYADDLYLKTLNLVGPVDNAVYINDNAIMRINKSGTSTLNISLAGTDLSAALKPEGIQVTNG